MSTLTLKSTESLSNEEVAAIAVAILEAKTRIFISTPRTFFSVNDEWMYIEINDDRLCRTCHANAQMEGGTYTGDLIRGFFPYLEILDENTIKVNEHPNCRCVLIRVRMKED